MKFFTVLTLVTSVAALAIEPRHHQGKGTQAKSTQAAKSNRVGAQQNGRVGSPGFAAAAAAVEARHHQGKGTGAKSTKNNAKANGKANAAGFAAAVGRPVQARHHQGKGTGAKSTKATAKATGGRNAGFAAASGRTVTARQNGQAIVLKETGGIPGNECLTFTNAGVAVDAACVNTAADRQLNQETLENGQDVLRLQRSFTAGFRQDLVGPDACLGFDGSVFKAVSCEDPANEPVTFENNELVTASGACANGHSNDALITVSTNGQGCAKFTSTSVTPTPP